LGGCTTSGEGFTVNENVFEGPGHPFAEGETVMVAVIAALVRFVAVNEAIFPLPLDAKPMDELSLVQL